MSTDESISVAKDLFSAERVGKLIDAESPFAFEIKVAKLLRMMSFDVQHTGTYVDPATEKVRQYDLRATWGGNERFHFAIECKLLTSPLLIHRTHRRQAEAYQDVMLDFHNNGMVAFPRLTNIEAKGTSVSASVGLRVVRLGWEHSTYPSGGYVGRSFDQISTSPKGELNLNRDDEGKIFSKMSQAVNSAMDLAKLVHLDVRPGTAWTVAPLLVVPDDMLFVANYNDEGEMIDGPKRTVRCQFYLGQRLELGQGNQYRRATMHLSHLDIITIGELQPILRDYALEGKNSERKRLIPLT